MMQHRQIHMQTAACLEYQNRTSDMTSVLSMNTVFSPLRFEALVFSYARTLKDHKDF